MTGADEPPASGEPTSLNGAQTDDGPPVLVASVRFRDSEAVVVDANDRFADALGRDAAAVEGEALVSLCGSLARTTDAIARLRDGEHVAENCRLVDRDGRTRETVLHGVPEFDPGGDPVGARAVFVDVSEPCSKRARAQSAAKIEKLHDIATQIEACESEAQVYELTVDAAERILEFDICGIDTIEGEYLVPREISTGMPSDGYDEMPVGEGIAGSTVETGESLLVDDVREDDRAKPAQDEYRSILSVPVGEVGVFQAGSKEVGAFGDEDVELAELLVSHVTEALNRIGSQEALRESEQKYRTVVEQSSDGIFIYRDGGFAFVNETVIDITGYTRAELYDADIYELVHPDDRDDLAEIVAHWKESAEAAPSSYEARILTKGGRVRYCSFTVTEITYDGERAVLGSARDVTDRKNREETLNALQAVTRNLMKAKTPSEIGKLAVEAADDVLDHPIGAVWLYDEDEDVLRPATITEQSKREVMPRMLVRGETYTWKAFERSETRVLNDIQIREDEPDGPVRSLVLVPLGSHGVFGIASTNRNQFDESRVDLIKLLAANTEAALDRAEREALLRDREQALERQNEKLEFLNSLLRHNILNGMTVIIGRTELLKRSTDGDARSHLDTVLAWADDIVDLIQKIRTLMESIVGERESELRAIGLDDVLREEIEKVRTSHPEAVVEGRIHDGIEVVGDDLLPEVFENLLSNAVVHNDTDDPTVTVSVEERTDHVTVSVADDGPGISDERKREIFGKGTKGVTSVGTGYGLYLVRTIVTQYGGDIWVEDNDPTGAVFVVQLRKPSGDDTI